MPDLNANDLDAAEKIIAGTARQMGVTVERLTSTRMSGTSGRATRWPATTTPSRDTRSRQ